MHWLTISIDGRVTRNLQGGHAKHACQERVARLQKQKAVWKYRSAANPVAYSVEISAGAGDPMWDGRPVVTVLEWLDVPPGDEATKAAVREDARLREEGAAP